MSRPIIQIDDEVREMTEEEYEWYMENSVENETHRTSPSE